MYQTLFTICTTIVIWEALAPLEQRGHYRDRFITLCSFFRELSHWAWQKGRPLGEVAIVLAKKKAEDSSVLREIGRLIGEVRQFNVQEQVPETGTLEDEIPGRLITVKPKKNKAIA